MTLTELKRIAQDVEAFSNEEFLEALARFWKTEGSHLTDLDFKRSLAIFEQYRKELFLLQEQLLNTILERLSKKPMSFR